MNILPYCLRLWLISIVGGTFLYYFVGIKTGGNSWLFWPYMVVGCVGATIYSVVSFALFLLGVRFLVDMSIPPDGKKILASVWATILTVIPFLIVSMWNNVTWVQLAELCGCYLFPLIAGIWLFSFPAV